MNGLKTFILAGLLLFVSAGFAQALPKPNEPICEKTGVATRVCFFTPVESGPHLITFGARLIKGSKKENEKYAASLTTCVESYDPNSPPMGQPAKGCTSIEVSQANWGQNDAMTVPHCRVEVLVAGRYYKIYVSSGVQFGTAHIDFADILKLKNDSAEEQKGRESRCFALWKS